jgi:class 3 adenylate cyclase
VAKVYSIGRSQRCDIVLTDGSVSRHHAELVLTNDGEYYLTDCGSSHGTFVGSGGGWRRVRQAFIGLDDPLMFGEYRTTARKLLDLFARQQPSTVSQLIAKTPTGAGRRLAAILAADVVGYSLRMSKDEHGTLAMLRDLRREIVDPRVAKHKGRIFKTMGDGLLVEFASVVDAVACAAKIQADVARRNGTLPGDRRMEFRIGINLGDVIIDGDDVFGDGVNIAARLEALAEPGGIFISGPVYDQVKNKLDFVYRDEGLKQVKNIPDPVRAYSVHLR